MKKRKIKKKPIIILAIIIVLIVVSLVIIFRPNQNNKLIGKWTTDNVTIYEFKKDYTGVLEVSLSKYEFTYEIKENTLYIDFKNPTSTDSEYTYSFKGDKLILKGKNGTFTFTKMA